MSNNADQEPPCGAVDALSCPNPQCKRREGMLKAEIDRLTEELEPVRVLQKEIAALEARLGGHGKRTKRTWPALLRRHLADPGFGISYARIHQICCMEENMSTKNWFVHPDIKLVAPDDQDRDSEADFDVGHDLALEAAPASDGPQTRRDEKSFPFDKLPWQLQGTILKLILHKRGRIIHCISRLDPFIPPASFPSAEELGEHRSGLKKVFFWGKSECSISSGVDPKDHLAILTVSKRFYFLGVHIFYGLNTFGFSSLGEFGRFAQGTGLPRIARIQHMELLLTGSQRLTAPLDTRGKVPMSRRTYPLSWLVDMYRLKTLVVHINETGWFHTRRKYENPTVKRLLEAKTRGQPNRRMSRSLRCVQGIDYVYQLRGMEWIRFYDVNQAFHGRRNVRHPVQDWSFSEDITNTTTLPKPPTRQQNAELENLEPLFTGENPWTPSADDWKLVKSVFIDTNGRCSYDDLRLRKSNRDADLASYLSVAGTAQVVDISSDSESDTESSDPTSEPSSDPGSDSEGPDSDSDSSDSDSSADSPSSGRSLDQILSSQTSSRSRSLFVSPGPPRPHSRTPATTKHAARRESTTSALFVIPGPPRPHSRTPATTTKHARRESTTSALFVSPGPPPPAATAGPGQRPDRNNNPSPTSASASAPNRHQVSSPASRRSNSSGLFVTPFFSPRRGFPPYAAEEEEDKKEAGNGKAIGGGVAKPSQGCIDLTGGDEADGEADGGEADGEADTTPQRGGGRDTQGVDKGGLGFRALGTIFEDDDTSDSDSESSSSSESESESSSESSDDDGAGGGGDDEDDSESDDDDSDSALEDLLAGVSLAEGRDLVSDLSSSDDDDEDESADSDSDDEVVNSSGGGSGKSLKRPLGGGWQKGSPGGKRPRVEV